MILKIEYTYMQLAIILQIKLIIIEYYNNEN